MSDSSRKACWGACAAFCELRLPLFQSPMHGLLLHEHHNSSTHAIRQQSLCGNSTTALGPFLLAESMRGADAHAWL